MRFIHTGDWHLGRLFHNLHLTADQRFTLGALRDLARAEEIDALVIAGDVFDRAVPPTEAVELLDDVLAGFALELGIPVVMIAGNHDSPVRLQYLNGLVGKMGVHVIGSVGPVPVGVEIASASGERVVFWPLAYTDPETARIELGRDDIHSHEEAIRAQLDLIRPGMDGGVRNVLVGHAFVTGGQSTDSERPLSVGGTGHISADVFEGFDYVALGHLHRSQAVTERVRYSGSLLKYSFAEADHDKSVTIVDLAADGGIACREARLPVRRDLVRLRGTIDELLAAADDAVHCDAYIEATLLDGAGVLDPMERLRTVFPNLLSLVREVPEFDGAGGQSSAVRSRTTEELFGAFFEDVTGSPLTDAQVTELADVLAVLERAGREVAS